MAAPFDPAAYGHAPIITVTTGISLAHALLDATPANAAEFVIVAAAKLKKVADDAQLALAARNRLLGEYTEETSRDLDNEADRIWGGCNMRLLGLAQLPHTKVTKARRAAELQARIFGPGMDFLRTEYSSQSAAMGALLQRVADDNLQSDLDDLAGPEFLQAMHDIQPRYEQMVSERMRRDKAAGQNLLDITRGLQAAIVNYARKVIATIDPDDPATTEAARLALLPIANHREAVAARSARNASDPTPQAPSTDTTPPTPASPASPADPT